MTRPLTEPGWYRARPGGGLELVAPLDDPPPEEDRQWLVKIELDETMVEEPLWLPAQKTGPPDSLRAR